MAAQQPLELLILVRVRAPLPFVCLLLFVVNPWLGFQLKKALLKQASSIGFIRRCLFSF